MFEASLWSYKMKVRLRDCKQNSCSFFLFFFFATVALFTINRLNFKIIIFLHSMFPMTPSTGYHHQSPILPLMLIINDNHHLL